MNYIQEYIDIINTATILPKLSRQRGSSVIVYDSENNIKEINISCSFIQQFFYKGERKPICPQQLYLTLVEKKYKKEPSEAMLAGLYLESALLGETADGNAYNDMERDKRTGAKKAIQKRIDTHISLWDIRKEQHGLMVYNKGDLKNIQVRQKVKWNYKDNPDITVNMYATADLISPFKDNGIDYEMAIIDIKGTADINSTFGHYCWGEPNRMDYFQLILYSRIYDIPNALYMVFDWAKNPDYKVVPINVNPKHQDPIKASEARTRIVEMENTIKLMIDDIINYEKHGWNMVVSKENCSKCPCIYCPEYGKVIEI